MRLWPCLVMMAAAGKEESCSTAKIDRLTEKVLKMAHTMKLMESRIAALEGLKPNAAKSTEKDIEKELRGDVDTFCKSYAYSPTQCDQLYGQLVRLQPHTPGHSTTLTLATFINSKRVFVPLRANQAANEAAKPVCNEYALVNHNCRMMVGVLEALADLRQTALRLFGIGIVTSHDTGHASSTDAQDKQFLTANPTPRRDIAILSMSTPEIKSYADLAHKNHLHYAHHHNYSAYVYKSVDALKQSLAANQELRAFTDLQNRHPIWWKILVVLAHLQSHKYVVWIDADAIFTGLEESVEDFIAEAPERHMFVCENNEPDFQFNSGFMVFKNTEWVRSYLHRVWQSPPPHDYVIQSDQLGLINTLGRLVDPTCSQHDNPHYYCPRQHTHVLIAAETRCNASPEAWDKANSHGSGRSVWVLHCLGKKARWREDTIKRLNEYLGIR